MQTFDLGKIKLIDSEYPFGMQLDVIKNYGAMYELYCKTS